jgi:hypothetical protein
VGSLLGLLLGLFELLGLLLLGVFLLGGVVATVVFS